MALDVLTDFWMVFEEIFQARMIVHVLRVIDQLGIFAQLRDVRETKWS